MKSKHGQSLLSLFMVLSFLLSNAAAGAAAAPVAAPQAVSAANWCVTGDFNSWNNNLDHLYDDATHGDLVSGDGVFSNDLTIPTAGRSEFKTVECGNWGNAFPVNNSFIYTSSANQVVKVTFDANDHTADAGTVYQPVTNIVNAWDDLAPSYNAVGDFQGWNNSDPAWTLTALGRGLYTLARTFPTPGAYNGKFVRTGTWDAFGGDGRDSNANNIAFTTTAADQTVVFLLDVRSGRAAIQPNGSSTGAWCAAGSFQGWDNAKDSLVDDGASGDLLGGDGIFSKSFTIATPGSHEWKAVKCGDWGVAVPAQNSWFVTTAADQVVTLTLDTNDHSADAGLKLLPAQNIVNVWGDDLPASFTAVGSFQGWDNSAAATHLASAGMGYHTLQYTFATAGSYIGKITTTGSWNAFGNDGRSTDAANVNINVGYDGDVVQFFLDAYSGRLAIIAPPKLVHSQDNKVDVAGLEHDSRDTVYRQPSGAVVPQTAVKLRLRTYHNDVTSVKVRFYDAAASTEFFGLMSPVTTDITCFTPALSKETCDYWELTYTPDHPTNLYYRFVIKDGADTAYYADTDFKLGGLGQATSAMVDNSYEITVYDPAFQPVPWMENAVIYQIFPDRFANGDPTNDPSPADFRYGYPTTAADQILLKQWSSLPEGYCRGYVNPATPCNEGPMGRDYFGGDLAGLRSKLGYLKSLGITVIYLNPVFESGSNHGYDTRDYYNISSFFGSNDEFVSLANEAHSLGMKIILDGVFNHVASDSPFFDRYHHYAEVGACESVASPYRDWFTFHDVPDGTGTCAGSGGPLAATYDAWFGYDSLPVLNKNNQAVKDIVYAASDSIARTWLEMGADGWRLDVMNDGSFPADFWPSFRDVVKDTKSDAMVIGELWKKADVLPLITGNTADTTMNYRFRNAILGFFGKVDNKGFPDDGQSDQPPSLFADKLLSVREDYPDATYYTLMNLMDSHDTERILWSLTPGAANRQDKELNAANVAQGKQMLRMAVVVQMTTPGAPTIFYGDEIGQTGSDDPDDRRTFPWMNYNTFIPLLKSAMSESSALPTPQGPFPVVANPYLVGGDRALLDYYQKMIVFRMSHPVVRTGQLSFLLTDDTNRTLAYLMRSASDAVLVAINRNTTGQTLTIDLGGKLPSGITLYDALDNFAPVTAVNGVLTVNLPPLTALVLAPKTGAGLAFPEAPEKLQAAAGNAKVDLSWDDAGTAASYNVYRSMISGGGYELLGSVSAAAYSDTNVVNGRSYYYVVRAVTAAGVEGPASNEASGLPSFPIGWAILQWPKTITQTISATPTENIYGQVYIAGLTDADLDPALVMAQVGFGATGSDPATWTTWKDMSYNAKSGSNYEYVGSLRPEAVGTYDYLVRFSDTGGAGWVYGDQNGVGIGTPGVLTVNASADTTPPTTPANLHTTDWSSEYISLAWDASTDPDDSVAEYWVYRHAGSDPYGEPVARVSAPATAYTDHTVFTGTSYTYKVVALDTALNRSGDSNEVTQTAEPKVVHVTFRVLVPPETPPTDTVYIAGDGFAQQWNPSAYPMTDKGGNIWETTFDFRDGLTLQYKFARGSWERVEWWGSITSVANRTVTISYGATGDQLVDLTATDWGNGADDTKAVQAWRDPLVTSTVPANGYNGAAPGDITVNFVRDIQPLSGSADFAASVAVKLGAADVAGTVTAPTTTQLVWTPDSALASGAYTVTVFNLRSNLGGDSVNMQQAYTFSFTVP